MQLRRIRFAIQSVMVAVALVALNLAGAIAVSKTRPREFVVEPHASFGRTWVRDFPEDALRCFFMQHGRTMEVKRALQEPANETLLQTSSPVIASSSITLLVLGLSLSNPLARLGGATSKVDETSSTRPSAWRQVMCWALIAIALLGLNFAATCYLPPLEPSEADLARHYFQGGFYLIKAGGGFGLQRPSSEHLIFSSSRVPGPDQTLSPLGVRNAESHGIKVATVVLRTDGSILGYDGRPGDVTSRSIVLRRPLRSLPKMWWPLIASTSITALVAVVLLHRARRSHAGESDARVSRDSMRGAGGRSTVEWAVIATTIACLNGAAAVATWKGQLREQAIRVRVAERVGWGVGASVSDHEWGTRIRLVLGTLDAGEQLLRFVLLRGRPTSVEIWSPVIASASITLLASIVFLGRSVVGRRPAAPNAVSDLAARRSPFRLARRTMIAAAMIGLNVAGATYGPYPEPGEERPRPAVFWDPAVFPDKQGGFLARSVRGPRAYRLFHRPAKGGGERPATADDFPLPQHQLDSRNRVLDTIVYQRDGSVVAYDGNAGLADLLFSRPRVIQPPTRSFFEAWWPVVTAGSLTVFFLALFSIQARRDRKERIAADDTRVDCAGAI
jgi:hypothetical protein